MLEDREPDELTFTAIGVTELRDAQGVLLRALEQPLGLVRCTINPDATITRSERAYRDIQHETDSWRHVAAMKVTGGLNTPSSRGVSPISYPTYAGVKRAMQAMGWTWPAFGVGAAGFLTGLILLLGSFVQRPEDAPA